MEPAGAGSLAQVINTAIEGGERMQTCVRFLKRRRGRHRWHLAGRAQSSPGFPCAEPEEIEKAARAAKAQEMI